MAKRPGGKNPRLSAALRGNNNAKGKHAPGTPHGHVEKKPTDHFGRALVATSATGGFLVGGPVGAGIGGLAAHSLRKGYNKNQKRYDAKGKFKGY